jgi:hypothetical protein
MNKNKNKLLSESHAEVVKINVKCRVMIEKQEDPTLLDIMTDMRALPGIVTVRQNAPLSDPVDISGHRVVELKITYIPSFISKEKISIIDILKSLKSIKGVDMLKLTYHDDINIMNSINKNPIVI